MKITFKNDLKNNRMKMTIKMKKRLKVAEEKISIGWPQVKKIIAEKYACPKTYKLGECLNPVQGMDNEKDNYKIWEFHLIPELSRKKSSIKKKKTVKK